MTPAAVLLANILGMLTVAAVIVVLASGRVWKQPVERADLVTALAVFLVGLAGLGHRLEAPDDLRARLAYIGWVAVTVAFSYKLFDLVRSRQGRQRRTD